MRKKKSALRKKALRKRTAKRVARRMAPKKKAGKKAAGRSARKSASRPVGREELKEITGTVAAIRRRYERPGAATGAERPPVPSAFGGSAPTPVSPVVSVAPGGHEKRKYPRFQVNFELYVKGMSSQAFQGQVEDMSLSGVRIKVARGTTPLSVLNDMVGDIFALEFVTANETVDVCNSRLVRVGEEGDSIFMAFQFGAIPDRIISKIFGLVFRASSG